MTKSITLTRGQVALVDDADYEWLNQWKWQYLNGYASRDSSILFGPRHKIFMHRLIAETPDDLFTDHANGNKLDNRRENLRVCTKSQNRVNSGLDGHNKSGYKGVFWDKYNQRWVAKMEVNRKQICLGYFRNIEDAVKAYDKAAREKFGEFAKTNADIGGGL